MTATPGSATSKSRGPAKPRQSETGDTAEIVRERSTYPPIPELLALIFALIGVGIAGYLTVIHYAKLPVACTTTGPINCEAVTTSQYSVVGNTNIPITVPGIAWFVVSGALAGIVLVSWFRSRPWPSWVTNVHLVWAILGTAFVLYLVYVEAVKLQKFCEWCTGVHILTILTFFAIFVRWQRLMAARYRGG